MRLVFDMDGTITEGKFLEPPRTFEMYMSLGPYDKDTAHVWNRLALKHEMYIMTARSDKRADVMIQSWLNREAMIHPTSIITAIPQQLKWTLARMMSADLIIDDSPNVAENAYNIEPELIMMANPYWKKACEHKPYPHIRRCASWLDLGQIIETINITKSYQSLSVA